MPKSEILTRPSLVRIRLAGFMSRCTCAPRPERAHDGRERIGGYLHGGGNGARARGVGWCARPVDGPAGRRARGRRRGAGGASAQGCAHLVPLPMKVRKPVQHLRGDFKKHLLRADAPHAAVLLGARPDQVGEVSAVHELEHHVHLPTRTRRTMAAQRRPRTSERAWRAQTRRAHASVPATPGRDAPRRTARPPKPRPLASARLQPLRNGRTTEAQRNTPSRRAPPRRGPTAPCDGSAAELKRERTAHGAPASPRRRRRAAPRGRGTATG